MCAYLPACPSSRPQALNADVAAACRTWRGPRYRHAGRDRGPVGQRHPPSPVRQPAPHSPCVLCAVHSTRMHYFCDCDLCCQACVLPSTGANCVCTLSLQPLTSRRPRTDRVLCKTSTPRTRSSPRCCARTCSVCRAAVRPWRPVGWTASAILRPRSVSQRRTHLAFFVLSTPPECIIFAIVIYAAELVFCRVPVQIVSVLCPCRQWLQGGHVCR